MFNNSVLKIMPFVR